METTPKPSESETATAGDAVIDLGSVALSLSGGGYRAAAFHLGTLDFLQYVGLLEHVAMLSTVSGGSITGAKYALSLSKAQSFKDFFDELYQFLEKTRLPELWLKELNNQTTPSKRRTLITAAAEVYDKALFGGARFDQLLDATDMHLKELVFNATELRSGLGFRFQKSESELAIVGNRNLPVGKDVLRKARIADIVAASSCFPGGFEPITFPHDFDWPPGQWEEVKQHLGEKFKDPLPLVDGGVYDGQGITSLLIADKRQGVTIGTFIISDTDNIQPQDVLFEVPQKGPRSWLTLQGSVLIIGAIFVVSLITATALIVRIVQTIQTSGFRLVSLLIDGIALLYPLGLILGLMGLGFTLSNKVLPLLAGVRVNFGNFWKAVRRLTISEVWDLVNFRVRSLLSLPAVFLKRKRSLVFTQVYSSETYKDRRVANLIYELWLIKKRENLPEQPIQWQNLAQLPEDAVVRPIKPLQLSTLPEWLTPTEKMAALSERATKIPTTLWFGADPTKANEQIRDLVACGQVTMCFNLLEHIILLSNRNSTQSDLVKSVYDRAFKAWEELKKDPFALLNRERSL